MVRTKLETCTTVLCYIISTNKSIQGNVGKLRPTMTSEMIFSIKTRKSRIGEGLFKIALEF